MTKNVVFIMISWEMIRCDCGGNRSEFDVLITSYNTEGGKIME